MFSVTRVLRPAPPAGREVGLGKLEGVPGTPAAAAEPELSSLRCEVSITERAGS